MHLSFIRYVFANAAQQPSSLSLFQIKEDAHKLKDEEKDSSLTFHLDAFKFCGRLSSGEAKRAIEQKLLVFI